MSCGQKQQVNRLTRIDEELAMATRRQFLRMTGVCAVRSLCAPLTAGSRARRTRFHGPLRACPRNSRYFCDARGKAIYLCGSHVWYNLVDMGPSDPPPRFDFVRYLDFLDRHGHNLIRLWRWEHTVWDTRRLGYERTPAVHRVQPHPWPRTGPGLALDGKPRFDLSKFCDDYFRRLRQRVELAGERGIYVSVMLFEGWAMQRMPNAWRSHPFHPANNINGIDGDVNRDGTGLEIHTLASRRITKLQEAYVRKVIATVGDLDNVLYEISNENHPASTEWQYHMIRFVKEVEANRGKQHPVGMTFQFRGGSNRTLFQSPADWISPNPEGGYRDNPPPNNGSKVVLLDTDHLWGIGGNVPWVWKAFTRGHNPLFMDPYDGLVLGRANDPRWEPIRRALGQTRQLAGKLPLTPMAPDPELASTGYCLAEPGRAYVVYVPPKHDRVTIDLSDAKQEMRGRWLDPSTGHLLRRVILRPKVQELVCPARSGAVLWLRA